MDVWRHAILVLVMVLLLLSTAACTGARGSMNLIEPSYSYVKDGVVLSDITPGTTLARADTSRE